MPWTEDDLPVTRVYFIRHRKIVSLSQSKSNGYFQDFRQYCLALTSDVVRCHQMSYLSLFYSLLRSSIFAKSESRNGGRRTSRTTVCRKRRAAIRP